ncbi:hypothetical protein TNCV_1572701 [Trichonephila clavipes]|uniref:Uncharacterized protein n=1 Tax=Trichonephila clavipes TaxID=2585209 RepID=A0A8X6VPB2_TRICX|nr:hypothetical protein TNCV_1572701 [Trichonephila clavipes]
MSSFLVLREGDNRNRWRDGQVCSDIGQGIMALWARRPGCVLETKKTLERGARPWMEKKPCPGSRKHERRALVGTDWKRALKRKGLSSRLERRGRIDDERRWR